MKKLFQFFFLVVVLVLSAVEVSSPSQTPPLAHFRNFLGKGLFFCKNDLHLV